MDWSSGFFTSPSEIRNDDAPALELVHSSEDGYSEIYRGISEGLFRAYKVLKPAYRSQPLFNDLLKKEYEIGHGLDHPNIRRYLRLVTLPELGKAIEMEWVDGVSLAERPKVDSAGIKKLVRELCDALSYIHSKQVVHCDIKPSNLMVTHNGGNLKLIDFGFSDSDSYALLKNPAGTRDYASPEQVGGGQPDCRSDIYSLGAVIKELLPKKRRVARKCMSIDPDKRFQSAEDVSKALCSNSFRIIILILALIFILGIAAVAVSNRSTVPAQEDIFIEDSAEDSTDLDIEDIFDEATKMIMDVSESE